jgi:hypothetical protein
MDTIMKKKTQKTNNFVAKHAQHSGVGQHVSKLGKHAPRYKQKRAWKKEISNSY